MAKRMQRTNTFKVVLLGEGRVGKTSLLVRFTSNKFNDREQATVQAAPFQPRPLQMGTQRVELQLWDTAGQERFHSLGPIYYRDAAAALIVFDITDIDSFQRAKAWVKELQQMVGPDIVITIAANKCDLEKERSVPDAVIAAYARQVGASYFNTSAKTGSGLDKAFQDIAKRALQQQQEKLASRSSTGSLESGEVRRRHGGLLIADDSSPSPAAKQSGCC